MLVLLATVGLGLLAWFAWPALFGRTPIPVHMLQGGSQLTNGLLGAMVWGAHAVKLLGLPATLYVVHLAHGLVGLALASGLVAGLLLALGAVGRRHPRSCAAGMRDEAAFVVGLLLIVAGSGLAGSELSPLGLLGGLATGIALAAAIIAAFGAVFMSTWGAAPRFTTMRRPHFRILADNPDCPAVICRVKLTPAGILVDLPRIAEGPVTFAVYDGRFRALAKVAWAEVQGPLEAKGHVRFQVGGPVETEADFRVDMPPGKYMLSIRNYRTFDHGRFPTVQVLS